MRLILSVHLADADDDTQDAYLEEVAVALRPLKAEGTPGMALAFDPSTEGNQYLGSLLDELGAPDVANALRKVQST